VSVHPAEHYAGEIGTAEQWRRREPPLAPAAVLGIGAVAADLAAAAYGRISVGAELRAVADPEYLVVLGADDALPWVDGARYLGWDGRALTLTTHEVVPAADLWRDAAIAQEDAEPASLVIVLPEQLLISAMPARSADPAALLAMYSLPEPDAAEPEVPGPRSGGMAVRAPVASGDGRRASAETQVGIDRRPTVVTERTGDGAGGRIARPWDETRPGVS
jgi:hypothetical protein